MKDKDNLNKENKDINNNEKISEENNKIDNNNNDIKKEEGKNNKKIEIDKKEDKTEDNNSSDEESEEVKNQNPMEFSIILVGDSNVGKTSIIKRFIEGEFEEKVKCTIDVDFHCKNLKIDKNLNVNLKIYDTAGQEKYRSITKSYYRQAEGILLVFDLTEENSYNKLTKWLDEISDNTSNVEIILVGNKSDLKDRKINIEEAEHFAQKKQIKFIETSAKDGTNIQLLFETLAISINKRKQDESSSTFEMGYADTYIERRTKLNKELEIEKESKCC